MKKLEILEENVKAAFDTGNDDEKDLLKKLFPDLFVEDPYLVACKLLGVTPKPPLTYRGDADEVSADAYYRLIFCIRAKNMINGKIWKPVYDGSEKRWYPLWKKSEAGFGLANSDYDLWNSDTIVGERLEYRTRELLLEGVKEFDRYYQDYLAV